MANKRKEVWYTGVTSNLAKRAWEHKEEIIGGFTQKYSCKIRVFYACHSTLESAILREKQIKAGLKKPKISLIEANNPHWKDLYPEIL